MTAMTYTESTVPGLPEFGETDTTPAPAKPAPNYARATLVTLNLILLVLVPILIILGMGALRTVKAEREEKSRVEFCEDYNENYDIPLEMCQ